MLALGCSSSSSSAGAAGPTSTKGSGGSTSTSSVEIVLNDGATSLAFVHGAPQVVSVGVTPARVYNVRFALVGNADDAYLDKSEADTDADGTASVTLTPPSSPSSLGFKLRASVDGASAELAVDDPAGTTTLEVVPAYAGKRPVTTWIATVGTDGKPCVPAGPIPPLDGDLSGQASADKTVLVQNVPLNQPLRVTVRAGQFAGGCTDVPAFAIGERRSVSVTVTDRPLQMNGVKIPVALGIDDSATWRTAWSSLATTMASSAVSSERSDASALLDAMVVATPYLTQDAFIFGRGLHGWDGRVSDVLSAGPGATGIRDTLTRWIVAGLPSLTTSFVSGTLTSPAMGAGTASLAVGSVGGVAPSSVGFSGTVGLTWTSAASDQVLFGATAAWQPSYLAATLAEAVATKEVTSASSVPEALAKTISCTNIGAALARDASDVPFLSCDSSCITERCQDALTAMWKLARGAATGRAAVHVTASGGATIDDTAHPVGFTGSWVGDASLGAGATGLTGSAKGAAAAAEPR